MAPRSRDWKKDLERVVPDPGGGAPLKVIDGRVSVETLPQSRYREIPDESVSALGAYLESEKLNTQAPRGTCVAIYMPDWKAWVVDDYPEGKSMPVMSQHGPEARYGIVKDEQTGEYKTVMLAFYKATRPELRERRVAEEKKAAEKAKKLTEALARRQKEGRFKK